jgi:hypothetical protein
MCDGIVIAGPLGEVAKFDLASVNLDEVSRSVAGPGLLAKDLNATLDNLNVPAAVGAIIEHVVPKHAQRAESSDQYSTHSPNRQSAGSARLLAGSRAVISDCQCAHAEYNEECAEPEAFRRKQADFIYGPIQD